MKTKRTPALLFTLLCLFSLMTFAGADAPNGEYIDLGNGFYMIVTTSQSAAYRTGTITSGSKSGSVYFENTYVGSATLYALFDISGSSAVATSVSLTGTGANGWTFLNGGTTCSGNRATGVALFVNNGRRTSGYLTLTCSPAGVVT